MSRRLSGRIQEAMSRLEGADPDRGKSTILVVDDEKGPRESLRMILSPKHRVLCAEDGPQALEKLREGAVEVVTVDLNMPGMKGDELMRTIRREHPQIEIIIITGCSSLGTAIDGIRSGVFDYLTKPFDVIAVSSTVQRALERRHSRQQLIRFLEGIGSVLGSDRDSATSLEELQANADLRDRLRGALTDPSLDAAGRNPQSPPRRTCQMIETLAETIESRDGTRRGHARRVAFLCGLIGEQHRLAARLQENLRVAAFLHDVGHIANPPDGLIEIPALETLLPSERSAAEEHCLVGERLIEPLGFPGEVAAAIRHHHENWNGSGYPDGLAGEAIPLLARIISVADNFDTLTSEHPYRRSLSHSEAIDAIRKQAGVQLDPSVVKDLLSLAETGLCGAGPLAGLDFGFCEDPADTIAAATAWIECDR
jgi:putative two-component system response regulator